MKTLTTLALVAAFFASGCDGIQGYFQEREITKALKDGGLPEEEAEFLAPLLRKGDTCAAQEISLQAMLGGVSLDALETILPGSEEEKAEKIEEAREGLRKLDDNPFSWIARGMLSSVTEEGVAGMKKRYRICSNNQDADKDSEYAAPKEEKKPPAVRPRKKPQPAWGFRKINDEFTDEATYIASAHGNVSWTSSSSGVVRCKEGKDPEMFLGSGSYIIANETTPISIRVDKNPIIHETGRISTDNTVVFIPVREDLITQMREGNRIIFRIRESTGGAESGDLSLSGFMAASNRLSKHCTIPGVSKPQP